MIMKLLILPFLLLVSADITDHEKPPEWYKNGDKPHAYDFITEKVKQEEILHLRSNRDDIQGFGTIMKNISSKPYRGRKAVFSAYVKTEDINGWVGLWMRVADSRTGEIYAYENMVGEAIKDTRGWKKYTITLEVDPDSDMISYGILLNKAGKLWMKGARIEVFTGKNSEVKVNKTR
jgi:hypothetical protein